MFKIFVIDDQKSMRRYLEKMLETEYEVTCLETLKAFKECLKNDNIPDLVITDLNLKEEDGRDVLKAITHEHLPVLVLTSEEDIEVETELLKLGASDYIVKPANADIILHRVKIHLALAEQKRKIDSTQDQLIQSEKLAALGQLAAGVAHEINNPVGFVTSNTNLVNKYISRFDKELKKLEEACQEDETGAALLTYTSWKATTKLFGFIDELRDISMESIEGLDRIKDIVKDLKDYAHVEEVKFKAADINKMLNSSINLLRNEIKYKAEVEKDLADLPPVECISSQINQIFVNIIVNACHAIEEFGTITVRSALVGERVQVEVTDTGTGIPEDIRQRIFDPFFTTKPIGKGTGIGLAITRSIIERHNGALEVDSEVGKGTTFRILLPLEQPDSEADDALTP